MQITQGVKRKAFVALVCLGIFFGISAVAIAVQISLDSPATLPSDI
ncbi:hypothetical protein [Agaribacter marinus]|uniref:Uncharacterized protein n=1 Tax=Agaribacter marinus TaxID=1431249 RepID=A0AA37SX47_9ALTE|nr:hypothetical protein [Agaribacter marinus]GLR69236.1 hypothetical protein GCM10007852_01440 [Agaribacter marinus]